MDGRIHGKQIKDTSLELLKLDLSGAQGTYILGTGSYLGTSDFPTSPLAYVNKQYVDSLSAGLDPKESVYLVGVGNVTINGTQSIDGVTASVGSRVLLTGQLSAVDNGIYVVSAGTWSRASDANGDPANEVSLGNYTFTERGVTFSSTGWVLYDTNATGATVSPGVNTQLWTQFNGAGSFIWGDGLSNIGNNIFVDFDSNGGLTFSAGKLKLADYVAGNGLTINTGVLNVGAADGITVNSDTVGINYIEASIGLEGSGLTASGGKLNVLTSNGLTIINDSVQISDTVAGNGLTFSAGVVNIIGSTAIGVNSDSIYVKYDPTTIGIDGNGALTVISAGDAVVDIIAGRGISGNQLSGPTASLDAELTDNGGLTFSGAGAGATIQVDYAPVASQLAGNGLLNNGTTIDVVSSNGGITISSNAIALQLGSGNDSSLSIATDGLKLDRTVLATELEGNGLTSSAGVLSINTSNGLTIINDSVQISDTVAGNGLTFSAGVINVGSANGITVNADTVGINYTEAAVSLEGSGLTASGGKLNVNTANGLTINNDNVEVASSIAGNGLTFSSGVIDINVVKGVTFSGDALFADASTILTTANLPTISIATNSTIQSALTAIDNKLSTVGAQEMIAVSAIPTGVFPRAINIPQDMLGITYSTASDGIPQIYMNGAYVKPTSSTSSAAAYFSTDGGSTGTVTVEVGSVLYLNANVLGYRVDTGDVVTVNYLTRVS